MEPESFKNVAIALAAAGPNPHYCPPINRWRTVEVVFATSLLEKIGDCRIGVILDSELSGALVLKIGVEEGELGSGHVAHVMTAARPVFACRSDEHGPPVGHERRPDPNDPERCLVCEEEKRTRFPGEGTAPLCRMCESLLVAGEIEEGICMGCSDAA